MISIDEKIKNAKRDSMILWLEGEHYRYESSAKFEKEYLKELNEQKAREEAIEKSE